MADTERDRLIARLDELVAEGRGMKRTHVPEEWKQPRDRFAGFGPPPASYKVGGYDVFDREATHAWAIRVELALDDLGGSAASARQAWNRLRPEDDWHAKPIEKGIGVLEGLLREVRAGRVVEPLMARARSQTEYELVAQATYTIEQGEAWLPLAAILGGAALELRLRRIAHGRITAFEKLTLGQLIGALAAARGAGTPTTDPTDDALLERWRVLRNDGAHRLQEFTWPADVVRDELLRLEAFLHRAPVELRT